jgi:hypothetical protein
MNPMGNFLPFDSRTRESACPVTNTTNLLPKNEIADDTYKHIFVTQPVTTSYPDSTGFAKFLFKDPSECRDTGYLCRSNVDQTLNIDRLVYYPKETFYQSVDAPKLKTYKFYMENK